MLVPKIRRSSASIYDKRDFDYKALDEAINLLTYGCKVKKYNISNGKTQDRIYYVSEEDIDYLQYIPPNRPYNQCRICLLDIVELRENPTSENLQQLPFYKVLQIQFSSKKHVLMFENTEQRDLFWQGLQYFIEFAERNCNALSRQVELHLQVNEVIHDVELCDNDQFDFKQLKQKLKEQDLRMNKEKLRQFFDQFSNNGRLSQLGYKQLLRRILNQEKLKQIFNLYQFNDLMNMQDFFNFINNEQAQKSEEEIYRLFANTRLNKQYFMSFQDFIGYILSDRNSIYDYDKQQIHSSYDHPLTDYWINSSHNTYLMKNQLTSESSIQAYINAFQKGCRCVELDCWDGPDNIPLIYHGYTMTSKITFESVIKCIAEYGFKYSKNPLILSLEVHCSTKQQDIMAVILSDYLANSIYLLPVDYANYKYYPTLNSLQRLILIKHRGTIKGSLYYRNKLLSQPQIIIANPNEDNNSSVSPLQRMYESEYKPKKKTLIRQDNGIFAQRKMSQIEVEQESVPAKTIHKTNTQITLKPKYRLQFMETQFPVCEPNPRGFHSVAPIKCCDSDDEESQQTVKKQESLKMSAVTTLFGVSASAQSRTVWEIQSLDENKVSEKLIDFHRQYFSRIYPAGTRVDSSNYNPIIAYNSGAQIVALNFQTHDIGMLINTCKFMENGGMESGYLLKPEWMRSKGNKDIGDFKIIVLQFTINFLIGFNLKGPNKVSDPQIKVSVRGIPLDEESNKQSLVKVSELAINPSFEKSVTFNFRCPELAFIIIEVSDGGKGFIGWTAIPAHCVCYGYRTIQLLSQFLKPIPNCAILVHVIKH